MASGAELSSSVEFSAVLLASSDEAFLVSIHEAIQANNAEFITFFSDVVVHDFPAETFLERPGILYDLLESEIIPVASSIRSLTCYTRVLLQRVQSIAQEMPTSFEGNDSQTTSTTSSSGSDADSGLSLPLFCLMTVKKCLEILASEENPINSTLPGATAHLLFMTLKVCAFAVTPAVVTSSTPLRMLLASIWQPASEGLSHEEEVIADVVFAASTALLVLTSNVSLPALPSSEFTVQLRSYFVHNEPRIKHFLQRSLLFYHTPNLCSSLLGDQFFDDLAEIRCLPSFVAWADVEKVLKEPHLLCLVLAAPEPKEAYQWLRLKLAKKDEPVRKLVLDRDVLYEMICFGAHHMGSEVKDLCLECLYLVFTNFMTDPNLSKHIRMLLPHLQTLMSKETQFGRLLLAVPPMSACVESDSPGDCWLIRVVLRNLFSNDEEVCESTAETLNLMLSSLPNSYMRLPSAPLRFTADAFVDVFYPVLELNYVSSETPVVNQDVVENAVEHLEILLDPAGSLRFSSLSQLAHAVREYPTIAADEELFSWENVVALVEIFCECMNSDPGNVGVDFFPLLLEILTAVLRFNPKFRLQLAAREQDPELLYINLLRGFSVFQSNWAVAANVLFALGVLLFAETLVPTADGQEAIPRCILDAFRLPFQCPPCHTASPYASSDPNSSESTLLRDEQEAYAAAAWLSPRCSLPELMRRTLVDFENATSKEEMRRSVGHLEIMYNLWVFHEEFFYGRGPGELLNHQDWSRITFNEITEGFFSRCPPLSRTLTFSANYSPAVTCGLFHSSPAAVSMLIRSLDIKEATDFDTLARLQAKLAHLCNLLGDGFFLRDEMQGSLWPALTAGAHLLKELVFNFHVSTSYLGRGITTQALRGMLLITYLVVKVLPRDGQKAFVGKLLPLDWLVPIWSADDRVLRRLGLSVVYNISKVEGPFVGDALLSEQLQLWTTCLEIVRKPTEEFAIKTLACALLYQLFVLEFSDGSGKLSQPQMTRQCMLDLIEILEKTCHLSLTPRRESRSRSFIVPVGTLGNNTVVPLLLSLTSLLGEMCRLFATDLRPIVQESKLVTTLCNVLTFYPKHPGNAAVARFIVQLCTTIEPRMVSEVHWESESALAEAFLANEDSSESLAALFYLLALRPIPSKTIEACAIRALQRKCSGYLVSSIFSYFFALLTSSFPPRIAEPESLLNAFLSNWGSKPSCLANYTLAALVRVSRPLRERASVHHCLSSILIRHARDVLGKATKNRKRSISVEIRAILLLLQSLLYDNPVAIHSDENLLFLPSFVREVWLTDTRTTIGLHVPLLKILASFTKNAGTKVQNFPGWSELFPLILACDCAPAGLVAQVFAQMTGAVEIRTLFLSGDSLLRVFQRVPLRSYLLLIYSLSMYEDGRNRLPQKLCFQDFVPLLEAEEKNVEVLALGHGIMRNLAFLPRNKGLILHSESAIKILVEGLKSDDPSVSLPALATLWTLGSNRARSRAAFRKLDVGNIIEAKEKKYGGIPPYDDLIGTLKAIFKTNFSARENLVV